MSEQGEPITPSKYAWREHASRGLPKRPVSERVADFFEIHGLFSEAEVREQASRCIQCPNPSCVTGCPLCNPIPKWMQLTAEGRFLEASGVLGSLGNMPEICARLCPSDHLCEGSCILESISEPVAIQSIERFLIDYALAHGQVDMATPPPNGFKVAVIGAGPGGLACAEDLVRKGYRVTVFDSDLLPGGLMVNGTPAFRLDHSIVERRVNLLKQRGVEFRLGVGLWTAAPEGRDPADDLTLRGLASSHDAVYLGTDARRARSLDLPGITATGVVQALPFLLQKKTPVALEVPPLELAGKRVIVIGGGDTAIDCARTAIRYGAAEVLGVYRRGEREMPCGGHEYASAVEEGVKYLFNAAPVAVLTDERNQVTGLRVIRTESEQPRTALGEGSFRILPGTESELPAGIIVQALGFEFAHCPGHKDFQRLAMNADGCIAVDPQQMTSWPGVYAGGDLTRGPSTVLDIVRDARRAAAAIDASLSGKARGALS